MKNHSKKILTAVFLVAALFVCKNDVYAQNAKRIEAAKGETSTVVKGTGNQSYIIKVGARQSCRIQLVSAKKSATLEVLDANGMDLTEGSDGRSFDGSFEAAGDYRINVTADGKAAFTLKITVE